MSLIYASLQPPHTKKNEGKKKKLHITLCIPIRHGLKVWNGKPSKCAPVRTDTGKTSKNEEAFIVAAFDNSARVGVAFFHSIEMLILRRKKASSSAFQLGACVAGRRRRSRCGLDRSLQVHWLLASFIDWMLWHCSHLLGPLSHSSGISLSAAGVLAHLKSLRASAILNSCNLNCPFAKIRR